MSTPACVYRVYDVGGTLLYVGSSVNPVTRYRDHQGRAAWWPFKCDISETWYDTQREAREAEATAIASEHPRWNVAGRSPEHPDGFISQASGRQAAAHLREEISIAREWRQAHLELARARDRMEAVEERIFQISASRTPAVRELRARHRSTAYVDHPKTAADHATQLPSAPPSH